MSGDLTELAETRKMLDHRYEEIKSSKVTPVEGEQGLQRIRRKSADRHGQ